MLYLFPRSNQITNNISLADYLSGHPLLFPAKDDDEFIFQEARRINAAQFQHISYSEYHERVVGKEWAERFALDTYKDRWALLRTAVPE